MKLRRLKSPEDFADAPKLETSDLKAIVHVSKRYAVAITPHVMDTMETAFDPVGRQYVPQMQELRILPPEMPDPIGDETHAPLKGIVHRYPDRLLLKLANVCAVYCRFCFRREKVGPGSNVLNPAEREAALGYIRANPAIWEVILSGGDPLVLAPRQIAETLDALCAIPHVQVIRFHTRIPVADPSRITDKLCAALTRDKAVYIAIHVNHAQEITAETEAAFRALYKAGCVLLSQSVLLKGVNDDAATLETLFRKLTALRVKPYYLHHPDLAPGTGHFRLSITRGRAIMRELTQKLSGIARPTYMLDIPGGHGKVPVSADYMEQLENKTWRVTDPSGKEHAYTESYDD